MATLPQYIQEQAKIFPLSAFDTGILIAKFAEFGDGPELRQTWENNGDGVGSWYPVKMHLCDILIDRTPDDVKLTEDHIYVRITDGRIHTYAASADKVERLQQGTAFTKTGRLEVILHI